MRPFIKIIAVMMLLFSLLFSGTAFAQITLKGKVTDDTNQPVAFAMLGVFASGDAQTAMVEKLTDEEGAFVVTLPDSGTYTIRVRSMSHQEISEEVEVRSAAMEVSLSMRQKEVNLAEVSVTTRKKTIQHELGKTIMAVEGNEFLEGKSSLEILQVAPGVLVLNNQINLNGMADAKVMLNNKLLNLAGADLMNFLGTLRSENIQSIEIMANPPAEYDANVGGLIHIIYKHPREQGLIGSVNSGYTQGRYGSFSNGASLHYKQGKLGISASLNHDQKKEYFNSKQQRNTQGVTTYRGEDNGLTEKSTTNARFGAYLDISPTKSAGVEYIHLENDNHTTINSLIDLWDLERASAFRLRGNYPRKTATSYDNVGFNYTAALDTLGSSIAILSDYTQNQEGFRNQANSFYTGNGDQVTQDSVYRNTGNSQADIFTLGLNYSKGFKNASKLATGVKYSQSDIRNDIAFDYLQDRWVNVTALSNAFKYDEKVFAGYIKYQGKLIGIAYDLGLRGEQTQSEGYSVTLEKENKQSYFNLFPSVSLKQYLNEEKGNYLTFSYSKRINRPYYSYLNPFVSYSNEYTTFSGNPYLRPEIDNTVDLSYYLHDNYSLTASYSRMSDAMQQVPIPDLENSSTNTLWVNAADARSYSLSLSLPFQVTKWWFSYNSISGIYQEFAFEGLENNRPFAYVQSQQQLSMPKGYNVSLTGLYVTKFNQGVAVMKDFYQVNLGVQKRFFQNKLSARLQLNDIFHSWRMYSDTSFKGLDTAIRAKKQTQTINLQLQYNFNLGKSFKAKKVERSSEEEKRRL